MVPELRDWVDRLHLLTSPSELQTVLEDMVKYVGVVLQSVREISGVESENRLWEIEVRRMGGGAGRGGGV